MKMSDPLYLIEGETIKGEDLGGILRSGDVKDRDVQLRGCRIRGDVDLRDCRIRCPITFSECVFEGSVNCEGATLHLLYLKGVVLEGALQGSGSVVEQGVFFGPGEKGICTIKGGVAFDRARIGGRVNCRGAEFKSDGGYALSLEDAIVEADVYLGTFHKGDQFTACGVSLRCAQVGHRVNCRGGVFLSGGGMPALNCENLEARSLLFKNTDMRGKVIFSGAAVETLFVDEGFRGADVEARAFHYDRLVVDGTTDVKDFGWRG